MGDVIVSVGMPVYNGSRYIRAALDSILAQTLREIEVVISDNASTDDTESICRSYAQRDGRIRYSRNDRNEGAAANFQKVFLLSGGKYFQWACYDDVWTPTLLERCVEVLEREPETVLCYPMASYIDEHGNPIERRIDRPGFRERTPHERFRAFLGYHIRPNECSQVLGLFRASVLGKTPLIESYPASDMILLGEVALHGTFHEIPEPLFLRRDHPDTSVRANPSYEERAVWFNPARKGKIQMPAWRWLFEWQKSIFRSPVGPFERVRCSVELGRWAWGNKGPMKRELLGAFRKMNTRTERS